MPLYRPWRNGKAFQDKGKPENLPHLNKCFRDQKRHMMNNRQIAPLFFIALLLLSLFTACSGGRPDNQKHASTDSPKVKQPVQTHQAHPRYARLFSVEYKKRAKVVRLLNPFDTTRRLQTYLLLPRGVEPHESLPEGKVMRIPVKRVALAHATHIGFFSELELLQTIKGVSQRRYVKNRQVKKAIEGGKIMEFGPSHNINIEKLLQANADLLFVAPFKENKYQKVKDVGVPVAVNSSYMENTPLARAEWIKFVSYFFNREKQASRLFDTIAERYNRLAKRVENIPEERPTIFSGKKIGQVWYVPGGKSYMARFLEDAGARYLWRDNEKTGSLPLDFESVFYKAEHADYWSIKENLQGSYSYEKLGSENIHYQEFRAFQDRQVIFCNTHTTPFYEKGILEPHIILADLVSLLHPNHLPGHQNKYYKMLGREK
jgi:iron complex transport system substrate-binding protein